MMILLAEMPTVVQMRIIVDGLCFGVLVNMDFIMICTYESDGKNPELLVYKKGKFQFVEANNFIPANSFESSKLLIHSLS